MGILYFDSRGNTMDRADRYNAGPTGAGEATKKKTKSDKKREVQRLSEVVV